MADPMPETTTDEADLLRSEMGAAGVAVAPAGEALQVWEQRQREFEANEYAARALVVNAVERGDHPALCEMAMHVDEIAARDPVCQGRLRVMTPGNEGRPVGLPCPLYREGCPRLTERRQGYRDLRLVNYWGFAGDFPQADPQRIPADIRSGVQSYCRTLRTRLQRGEGMVIGGGVGAGKSCCLAVIAQAVAYLEHTDYLRREDDRAVDCTQRSVVYLPSYRLFDLLHHEPDAAAGAQFCDLLLLDDLGTEFRSELAMMRFFGLMDSRWAHRRSTVIATNLSRAALKQTPDLERLLSRWGHRNPWLETTAGDQRQPASVADWTREAAQLGGE